jgi:DNA processing protein
MNPELSPDTQAILLLTAPLIAGRGQSPADLLRPSEYIRLARKLRELHRRPGDLLAANAADLLHACHPVVDEERLRQLLDRGFLLGQAVEGWRARAIWVVSRADRGYPRRFWERLRENAPPVIYGCGDGTILEAGGLAVVGSRDADEDSLEYARAVGRQAAGADVSIVSGGAKGIDRAAMSGALDAGGRATGVLADGVAAAAVNRQNRDVLMDRRLVLISCTDPQARLNRGAWIGNAMHRNNLIYALSDAALVVRADRGSGGTWNGAVEQLEKRKLVPVYVRPTRGGSPGLDGLRQKGALEWPEPRSAEEFVAILASAPAVPVRSQAVLDLVGCAAGRTEAPAAPAPEPEEEKASGPEASGKGTPAAAEAVAGHETGSPGAGPTSAVGSAAENVAAPENITASRVAASECVEMPEGDSAKDGTADPDTANGAVSGGDEVRAAMGVREPGAVPSGEAVPAERLFGLVRDLILQLLAKPMKDSEIAAALDLEIGQARAWLARLVDEGELERRKRPAVYVVKPRDLFASSGPRRNRP